MIMIENKMHDTINVVIILTIVTMNNSDNKVIIIDVTNMIVISTTSRVFNAFFRLFIRVRNVTFLISFLLS